MRATVLAVEVEDAHTYLAADAPAGTTDVLVYDASVLAVGAQAVVGGVTADVLGIVRAISPDAPDVVSLAAAMVTDVEAGERVDALPVSSTTTATVMFDDTGETEDVVIDQKHQSKVALSPGVKDEPYPVVTVEVIDGVPTIAGIEGRGEDDAANLVGELPQEIKDQVEGGQNPVQPDSSPTPVAVGLLRQFIVRVEGIENASLVDYEYHVSPVSGFTPDASTMSSVSSAVGVAITELPDGTQFAYDTDYFFTVVATSGPLAAAPSAETSAQLDRAGTEDIQVGSITAAQLSSIITLSSLFRTAASGARGEWDTDSLRFYDSLGAEVTRLAGEGSFFGGDAKIGRLETDTATMNGLTSLPPGSEVALGTGILEAPGSALSHVSVPLARVALEGGIGGAAFTDDAGTYVWQIARTGAGKWVARRSSWAGAKLAETQVLEEAETVLGAAATNSLLFVSRIIGTSRTIVRRSRPSATTFGAAATETTPAAPGTGGYADGEPVIGVQRGTGDVLLAHRVQGAQTIGGQVFADQEVMVRRYTPTTSGSFTLTLNKTIKTGQVGHGPLTSVGMDAASGMFDLAASSGNTAFFIAARTGGLGSFGFNHIIMTAANSGATVTAGAPSGPWAWYGDGPHGGLGLLWDGAHFWSTDITGDSVREYSGSNVGVSPTYHAYTFWNGSQETALSPVFTTGIYTRLTSRWSIPALPPGVSEVRLYVASANTRTRFERVGEFSGTPGQPLMIQQDPILPPAGAATSPPPATSNYAGGNVAKVTTGHADTGLDGAGRMTSRDPVEDIDVVNLRRLKATPLVGMQWRGTWSASTDYAVADGVAYAGLMYFAVTNPAVGAVPGVSAAWQAYSVKGDAGPEGPEGPDGPVGPTPNVQIGTVSTGAAAASMGGTTSNPLLNLVIPTGNILQGTGSPEGVLTASPGAVYSDIALTLGVSLWRKASGTGSTGWVVLAGDTGRRDISGTVLNGWQALTRMVVRRVNETVFLQFSGLLGSAATSRTVLNLPVGFRPELTNISFSAQNGGVLLTFARARTTGVVEVDYAASPSNDREGAGSWAVTAAWPTSLPGVAA